MPLLTLVPLVLTVVDLWPAPWNDGHSSDAAMQAAYVEWAKSNDWTSPNAEEAFLLGVDVADYLPLSPVSIARVDGKVSIGTSADLKAANGRVFVKASNSLDAPDDDWEREPAVIGEDATVVIELDGRTPARFFKVCVGY